MYVLFSYLYGHHLLCHKQAPYSVHGGTRWRSWLRHCTRSRKVAGSVPGGVIGISHNHSGRTVALGSTQPLTEMSTSNISSGVKAADFFEIWELQPLESSEPVRACTGIALPLHFQFCIQVGFVL
jgi:hypothetical protein